MRKGALVLTVSMATLLILGPAVALSAGTGSRLIVPIAKRSIDKSCIMMCDKWGPNDCEKWVMRCKGDPGYPKTIRQLERSP